MRLLARVFIGGHAVSMLGDGLAVLAIPLLVLRSTGSPVLAALASAPRSVGYLAAGIPAGVLADRLDPWRVLVGADIIRASIFLGLFVLTGLHRIVVWPVLALAFTAGAATVFFETALTIAVRDVFTGPRLLSANASLEAANQGGQVSGPAVAGLLAAPGLLHVAMLIDALTFLVSLASLAFAPGQLSRGAPAGQARRVLGGIAARGGRDPRGLLRTPRASRLAGAPRPERAG